MRIRTTQRTRTARSSGNRPPHQPATPPSAPPASAPQTTTPPPPPTDSDHPPPEVWVTVLERGHYYVIAAMARQRDRHHARPRDRPTRGSRGPHHPAQGPQGRIPARGQAPSPRPGPNHLREGGLPPGIGHALPDPLDPAPLATHGDRALGLGHPNRPHTSRGRPGHATKPPPPDRSNPSPAGTTPSTGSSTA